MHSFKHSEQLNVIYFLCMNILVNLKRIRCHCGAVSEDTIVHLYLSVSSCVGTGLPCSSYVEGCSKPENLAFLGKYG